MASDGKYLEELVAFVEETLVPKGFTVATNKRVFNDEGQQIAEFDVEIDGKLGSTEVKWLIECRDRPASGSASVGWIEQLVGRRDRFHFSKVTAVSTTGFTDEARRFASNSGIELREVKSISPEQFSPWLDLTHMTFSTRMHKLDHATILFRPPVDEKKALGCLRELKSNSRFLKAISNGHIATAQEAFLGAVNHRPELWNEVEPNGASRKIRYQVIYDNDLDHYTMAVDGQDIRVDSIIFLGELILSESEIPAQAIRYAGEESEEPIAEVAKFAGAAAGENLTVELHRIPDSGYTHVLLRRENK